MEDLNVFSGKTELDRLATQNRLLRALEEPIFREYFAGKHGLNVLDVGCNNGEKTVCWFDDPAVERVLGLEHDAALAQRAQAAYGGGRFRFCPCDVEAEDLAGMLSEQMSREGLDAFDVIYLSFVLSHLRSPETLLRRLRPLLRPGGLLVAVETDDARARLAPQDGRFREFLDILSQDPFAGDRSVGGRLPGLLAGCGYQSPVLRCDALGAGPDEPEKQEMIFEMFFSYLPEDVALLRAQAPEDARYARWERWMRENHAALRRAVCAADARVSMGMSIVTCGAEPERS